MLTTTEVIEAWLHVEFVQQLQFFTHKIGTQGLTLSGGQRQRLSIAGRS